MPDSSWLCPEGKYSIFTRRPQPPPLSAYPIQASANRKRDQAVLSGLDDALDEGPASLTLQEILRRESKAERGRAKYRAYEAGKRSAGKKRASSSNDDDTRDQGSANDAGDEFTEGAESQVKRRKRERQSATPEVDSELPQVPRPQTEMPDDFPSSDLLSAIHLHAANQLSSSFNILPRITDANPLMPDHVVAHFDALHAQMTAQEEARIKERPRPVVMNHIRSTWAARPTSKHKLPGRKDVWRNAERAFDSSALVALGMFVQIMAEHEAGVELPRVNDVAAIQQLPLPDPGMEIDVDDDLPPLPLL